MPTTRRQAAILEGKLGQDKVQETKRKRSARKASNSQSKKRKKEDGPEVDNTHQADKRSIKKAKQDSDTDKHHVYESGTIERGHIFFLYRPRVELEEVQAIDDIRNFHMLLIPRPPEFTVPPANLTRSGEERELTDLKEGADAVPASDELMSTKKHYRWITVGKKRLPDPEMSSSGETHRKETFWATVTAVGDDLGNLTQAFQDKYYETKTRGTRHEGPVRLVARGGYALVNQEAMAPSQRETHLGYHVSHPPLTSLGDVQKSLGIYSASSFVVQVKNPLAPATGPQQVHSKPAEYPEWMIRDIFGKSEGHGQSKGRESYGLRFVSCETPELLDYKGAELLLIASRQGEEGLNINLGESRGRALSEKVEEEAQDLDIQKVFAEIGLDIEKFPVESLQGKWA